MTRILKLLPLNMKSVNKVLLIVPPCTLPKGKLKVSVPPLGIAYVGAVIEKDGYNVKIIDAPIEGFKQEIKIDKRRIRYGLSYEQIKDNIREFNPDIVGISCHSTNQFGNSLEVCRIAKEVNNKIITVMGGIHPSSFPEQILKENKILDFIIISEGEYSFRDLLENLNKKEGFSNIDGIAYRNNNEIKVNPKTKFIENLDELPFPARHLLNIKKYFKVNVNQNLSYVKKTLQVISSRGCPYRCTFCATTMFWGNKHRSRSPEDVISEIDHLIEEYNIKELQFTDDSMTSDYKKSERLFELLKQRNLRWCTPNGINVCSLDEKLIRLMKDSGCYEMRISIESGNQEILNKVIQKPVDLNHVRKIMAIANKVGLTTGVFFVIGFPGETLENIRETFCFAREIKPGAVFLSIATPLPGTKLMDICREKGYLEEDFSFSGSEFTSASIQTEEFSKKDLEKIYIRESLLLNIGLIFRNPKAFLWRYGYYIICHPRMVFSYVFNYLKR